MWIVIFNRFATILFPIISLWMFNTDRLLKLGYRVDLVPVDYINSCVFEMCGHEVFRCNIQNLLFNMHYSQCPVSERAIEAVIDSSEKLKRARSYLWFWRLIEDQLFKRNHYLPKDYWPSNLDLKPFISCLECANCSGLQEQRFDKTG